MKKWLPILLMMALACMLAFAGCGDEDTDGDTDGDDVTTDGDDETVVDGDDEVVVDGDDEVVVDGDDEVVVDGDDEVVANPPADGETGAACEAKEDCDDAYCVTQTGLADLGLTTDPIPGGYCSALMCRVDGSGETCLADADFCFSLYPFKGDTFKAVGLCSRMCTSDADCRADGEQSCWDLNEMVDSGLDQAVYDELYKDQYVCLPDSLITVIKASLEASAEE